MVNFQIVNRKDENTILRFTERIYTGQARQSHAEDDHHASHSADDGFGFRGYLRSEKCEYFPGR